MANRNTDAGAGDDDTLPAYTLLYDIVHLHWDLRNDVTGNIVDTFGTREEATQGDRLDQAVGSRGGSISIQNQQGNIEEQRTVPQSRDTGRTRA